MKCFYGELEDLDSAREYLASLPYVDPKRIYVVGHSTGEREHYWLVNTVINSGQYSLWEEYLILNYAQKGG